MREIFTEKSPWRVAMGEREQVTTQLKEQLSRLNNVEIDRSYYHNYYNKNKSEHLCSFSLNDVTSRWSHYDFHLLLNDKYEMAIEYSYHDAAIVSNIAEIEAFIAACQEQLDRQAALLNRRTKVRQFKAQAIIAQVKQIADEDNFEFFTENDTVKLKLFVRLSKDSAIEIHIPFKQFQEVLPNLRSIIASVREVYKQGVKFKISQVNNWHDSHWIKPSGK